MLSARRVFLVLAVAVLIVCWSGDAFGAVYGTVKGWVVDNKTGEGLPSVAIQIVGTNKGVLTGLDGSYLLLNVSPGTYSIQARLIGYQTVQVDGVRVITDRSVDIDIEMQQEEFESGIIQKVTAERDIMEMKKPTSNVVISSEQIEAMPVQNVEDVLATTVGVVRRYGELHIRGGRSAEISFMVDGVETKDPLGGLGPTDAGMNLSSSSVAEIQIIKGGYDPEYGRAMSGVVTVNTKTGTETTERHLELYTDNFGDQNLKKYSQDFDRVYFSMSGPEPLFAGRLLPALGLDYFKDKLFYFFAIDGSKSNQAYNFNDYVSPLNKRSYREHNILGFTLKDRQANSFQILGNLVYRVTSNIRMVFNYSGTWDDRSVFDWYYRDTPATAPIENDKNERLSLSLTHQVNKTTFYELQVSRMTNERVHKPDDPDNPGKGKDPGGFRFEDEWEDFVDLNGNGVFDPPEPFIDVFADTSYEHGGRMFNFGDVFIPSSQANVFEGWDDTRPYHLYDPWYQDSIRYNYYLMYRDQDRFRRVYVSEILWDWNGNGLVDYEEFEPFVDLNGNGRWDRGDRVINDQNGNGLYDEEFGSVAGYDREEPYIDGDINLGEPFFDLNNDGIYQEGIDLWIRAADPLYNQDLNGSGEYDGPNDPWTPGIPFKDLNGNGIYDRPNGRYDFGEPFVDLNGNGKWDGADRFLDRGYDGRTGVDQGTYYHERSAETWTIDFKISKQLVREHDLRAGFQVLFRDLSFAELKNPWIRNDVPDGGPWPDHGIDRDFYSHKPVEGAIFLQDVIEYGSLMARVGFRYDFFFQSSSVNDLVRAYQAQGRTVIDNRSKLSPRIGVSYPISERAKIYFNYGHFYQLPLYTQMYRRLGFDTGYIGNPNLDYQKTVSYEFGVRYNLSGDYVIDINGFYKDIFGIINTQTVRFGGLQLSQYSNSDYGRARGFEIQLEKKYGDYVSGYVNYTYAFAYGKASSEIENYQQLIENKEIPIQEYPLDWDRRHAVQLNFDLRITKSDHPRLFGYAIPNDWGVNVLWQFFTGYPFTPSAGYPGLRLEQGERVLKNSQRYPSTSSTDLRFSKNFSFWKVDYSFQLWVLNVFNTENVNYVYPQTGRPDTHNVQTGIVRGDLEFYQNPFNYDPGRHIQVALIVHF